MESLSFKTNIQLKSIIGKDLINDDNIAILELVKNSFDANAKRVDIIFKNLKHNDDKMIDTYSENTSRIIIKDNGSGIDLNKWLNIAYSEKKSNNRKYNRMMAGAKGVGRFSCDRLGEYLNLYARKNNTEKFILLKIDWNKFEIEDEEKQIQSVVLDCEELSEEELQKNGIKSFENGTVLEIIKLRSKWVHGITNDKEKIIDWNIDKFINLKKYLEKLINPNQAFEKNDFGIYLEAPEFIEENNKKNILDKFIGKVENTIFEKLDFKTTSIESEIIENGAINLTTLKDKGQTIFWIKERNEFYPSIKNVKLNIYFLNPYTKAFFTKQTGVRSVDYGSIYLFINGFRISPYGEVDNDWLKLDRRKTQGYNRYLGTRELVGTIEIIDLENDFPIVTSREGLVKNKNYEILADKEGFIYKSLKRLEKYVVDGLDWDSSVYPPNDSMFKEIEDKIIKGEIDENDSRILYKEDYSTKREQIYQTIHSIISISAKSGNVIELSINENLILEKIQEERINAEREFEQLISDFEAKKIDGETLNRILKQKANKNKELEKQINDFLQYSSNEVTAKAITELQYYKSTIEKQEKIIEDLKLQLERAKGEKEQYQQKNIQLQQDAKNAEERAEKAEEEKKKTEAELEREKKQGIFQRSIIGREKEQIIGLQHQIYHSAGRIKKNISDLLKYIDKTQIDSKTEKYISVISLEIDKIESLSKFITNANFDLTASEIEMDIVQFITDYIKTIYSPNDPVLDSNLKVKTENPSNIKYLIEIRPLEITNLIDNFVQNSEKAKSSEILFSFKKQPNNKLLIRVSDDGKGILPENLDKIFDFGYTTTNGSGIGLYHIKSTIQRMKGQIKVSSKEKLGTIFEVEL